MSDVAETTTTACKCTHCQAACAKVPGWFAPAEAVRAIEAGYANRMVAARECDVIALMPAPVGKEGTEMHMREGRCTFFTKDKLCEIHASGFKPIECATGFGCRDADPNQPSIRAMHRMWRSDEGQAAVTLWRRRVTTHIDRMGRCPVCFIKPLIYKAPPRLFCCRCDRQFDIKTGAQVANWAWIVDGDDFKRKGT